MKKYIVIYLFFIAFSFYIFAEDSMEVQIKSLVEKIQNAEVKDKRELMNQLKLKLREINKESRKKTVLELKDSFNKRKNNEDCKRFDNNREETVLRHRQIRHFHFRSHK